MNAPKADAPQPQADPAAGEAARWRGINGELLRLALALQFLTRVPLPGLPYRDEALNEAARYFVAVGALVGAWAAAVLAAAAPWLPPAVAVLLALAAAVLATGAFHEDGLADTADALGAHGDRTRALAIMKDSRIGSFGVLALLLVLALKFALLQALLASGVAAAAAALIVAHGVSRLPPVLLIATLPYAGNEEDARARPLARRVGTATAATALASAALLLLMAAMLAGVAQAVAAAAATAAVAAAMRRALRRWLGGFTGDTLGASQQLTETAIYLGWVIAFRLG
jgi:adenosylcobinamide-GDP ribazoletransferase